jgi:hypothetical protein
MSKPLSLAESAFEIKCFGPNELKERMIFLFSKGMVFTTDRIRTWDEVEKSYPFEVKTWYYIRIGHNDCLRVMNTSNRSHIGSCIGYRVRLKKLSSIKWDAFVKHILPLL